MKKYLTTILCAAAVMLCASSCELEEPAVTGTCTYTVNVMCTTRTVNGGEALLAMDKKVNDKMMEHVRSWNEDWGGQTKETGMKKADNKAILLYALDLTAIKNVAESLREELKGDLGQGSLKSIYEVSLVRDGGSKKITDSEVIEFNYPAAQ